MPAEAHLHSDVQEIMVTKPSLALQWGNVLITALVLLLLAFAAWFQYPEMIKTDISLAAQHTLDSLAAPAGNQGALLLLPSGTLVRRGTPLLVWQDAARTDYYEAQRLQHVLTVAATASLPPHELARLLRPIKADQLGTLRPAYQALLAASTSASIPVAPRLATCQKQLRHWQEVAVAVAPSTGIVKVSHSAWLAGAPVPAGQVVLHLVSRQANYVALGTISREQYATVRKGQRALVHVHELGSLVCPGQVVEVAPQAYHQRHRIIIALPPPAGQRLYPSFSGSARIMLKQQSLLAKLTSR